MKIGIVGAGHAGVSAAWQAVKCGASVTLFSEEGFLPYYRPRVTSVAFLQSCKDDVLMHPQESYIDDKIDLVLRTKVISLDTEDISVVSESGQAYKFDKIIITTGAKPIAPPFARNVLLQGRVFPLWTLQDALTIRKKIPLVKSIVIIGGGLIGIESALRAADAGLMVTIIEKANSLMSRNLSQNASSILGNIINEKCIKLVTNTEITEIKNYQNGIEITSCFEKFYADIALLSIGSFPNINIGGLSSQKSKIGIQVNTEAQTKWPNIFAAGDVAIFENISHISSAVKASKQGKVAGNNAAGSCNVSKYKPAATAVELKFKDVEIHSIGITENNDTNVEEVLESSDTIFRSIIKNNNEIVGINMVGSGKDFASYKRQFNDF